MAQPANPQMVAQPFQPGQNVYGQSSQALTGAMNTTNAGMGYQPMTLAGTNLRPYQNPYTRQVIDATMGDMNRARTMAVNDLGASATRAGAFGGSRHGVAEAETNRNFIDQAGQMAANLRSQGFQNAQQAAQFDAGQNLAGANFRLGAAGQMANLGNMGFGMGQQITQQQMQQGAMQQALQQQLIDAAKGQYAGFTGSPQQALQTMLASVGAANMGQQSQTASKKPGLFDYLTLPFMAMGG